MTKISNYLSIEVILYSGWPRTGSKMDSYVAKGRVQEVGGKVIPNGIMSGRRVKVWR